MNKKIFTYLVIITIIIVAVIFFVYQYMVNKNIEVENYTGGISTENQSSQIQNDDGTQEVPGDLDDSNIIDIQAEGDNGGGTFSVCLDKCGDGVCQTSSAGCQDGLNCTCIETPQDCSQDCQ